MIGLTGASWAGLVIQTVAALAAAAAAIFAAVAARRMKEQQQAVDKQRERESRARAGEQLKLIHRLVTEVVEAVHSRPAEAIYAQLRLGAEVQVTPYVSLPKCTELVNDKLPALSISDFDRLASASIRELDQAQRIVWDGYIEKTTPPTET